MNRRCVVRVRSRHAPDAPGLFFKAFRRSPAAEAIAFVERLVRRLDEDSSGVLRLPALVKHVPDQRLIVTAEIPQDACPLGTSSRDTTLAGGALATLHGHAATDGHRCLPKHTPSAELATVARWISVLSRVSQPGDATRLARITDSLTVKTDAVSGARSSLLHRDFHHAQLMRRDETLWLVDLDTLCVGHAELDLSTFLAHAYLETLRDGHNPAFFGETTTPFLEGYLSHGGRFDRVRLGYYLPCALARLAALQLTRGLSREAVEQMWTLAERILEHPLALNDILGT